MTSSNITFDLQTAKKFDSEDPLRALRDQYHIPKGPNGDDCIYFCGNSLGLQPKAVKAELSDFLDDWANLAVEAHFKAKYAWMPYHRYVRDQLASIVGAQPNEVVAMNSLSVNLHLMMVSFYQPTPKRHKILIEDHAFPSDHYAVESQIRFHQYDPSQSLITLSSDNASTLQTEHILETIEREGSSIALVLLPGVQYYTGQVFDLKRISQAAHAKGCRVGFDLAHSIGNLPISIHDSGCDFAVWCSYKYLNSGPGAVAGCFIHERHHANTKLPRFNGWWGHQESTRFKMCTTFMPTQSADGWQLSNPPIMALLPLRVSLDLFDQVGIGNLREKSLKMSRYFKRLLDTQMNDVFTSITPTMDHQFASQFSLVVRESFNPGKKIFNYLTDHGIVADWREPNVIRIAPVPMYNSFQDIYRFTERVIRMKALL